MQPEWFTIGIVGITAAAAVACHGFFVSWRVSRRAQALRAVIRAVSKGNGEKRAKAESNDEMGKLAQDLNVMIDHFMEAKQLPENILRSMKDGLFVVDTKGNIGEVNQAALDMLGYTREELVGKPLSAVFVHKQ